jgi:hypothetical protein
MTIAFSTRSAFWCIQSLLVFTVISICLFLLSIFTYFTLRRHLTPVSHMIIPMPLGLPSSFHSDYFVSRANLSDTSHEQFPLDISSRAYKIELDCRSPRSYINRQLGSFAVELRLYSSSDELILEHSRSILFPYQSAIVRLIRILAYLPWSFFLGHDDHWHCQQVLIERLVNHEHSKRFLQMIQLHVYPTSFQLDQCHVHIHLLNLTSFAYSFIHYPLLTSVLSICVLFSIYMTFCVIIVAFTLFYRSSRADSIGKHE